MIDYKAIIENLDNDSVIKLMSRLGADHWREEENCIVFPTICHNCSADEASMKLYFYKNSKQFVCYTQCGQSMSIFNFLKQYYEVRGVDYDWARDILQVIQDCSKFRAVDDFAPPQYDRLREKFGRINREVPLPRYDEKVLEVFEHYYAPEWLNDGISPAAMDKFGILFSVPQNKIVIPHRDINGNLVGIRGRALDPWEVENLGKYMPMQIEQTWYKHPLSMNLYGLYENHTNIAREGICYLFEGEKSVLLAENLGRSNCALAVCGSSFNKFQLNLVMRHCHPREIVLCFDNEEKAHQQTYFNKLWQICQKYKNYCNFSFVYDRESLLAPKQSPIDNGKAIFDKLIERRVVVNNK